MLYEADGTKTPSYTVLEEIKEIRKNFDVSCLLYDFESLSDTREYDNYIPMRIKYREIESYFQLEQSKSLSIIKNPSDQDKNNIIKMLVDIDRFFINMKYKQIKEEKNKT